MANNAYNDPTYKRHRQEILQGDPMCHLCGKAGADTADHIIPLFQGGTNDLDNLRPAHRTCNSAKGSRDKAKADQQRNAARNQKITTQGPKLFFDTKSSTPTPFSSLSESELAGTGGNRRELAGSVPVASDLPRLATPVPKGLSYGPQVVDWADRILGKRLMAWQRHALNVALTVDDDGRFVSSKVLVSVGRQNGKTTLMEALIGWLLTEFPKIEGRKISILSTAHELDLAVESFLELADILKDGFGAKVTYAYGRNQVVMADGSIWKVKASTGKKHGGTWDFILGDELWSLSEAAVFGALLPSQIAVPNPLSVWLSTAGDESSAAFLRFREQGLNSIDKDVVGDLAFMEWSVPNGVGMDDRYWGYANPALGTTITLKALHAAAEAPDKIQFMRAHLNQWVSAAGSWLAPNLWAELETTDPVPVGGVLAVDSSVDDARFIGVRAVPDGDRIHLKVEFVVDTETKLWTEVETLMADPALVLALTPTLEIHCPKNLNRRYSVWGYGELLKFTALVRGMIYEKRVNHHGETVLAEHMNRAVMAKTVQGAALSSQKSAGPIELARASVIAVALASKPKDNGKPFIVVSNR